MFPQFLVVIKTLLFKVGVVPRGSFFFLLDMHLNLIWLFIIILKLVLSANISLTK